MCGIFGMKGAKAVSATIQALKYLEYRGYDSAGLCGNDGQLHIYKTSGRVEKLREVTPKDFETPIAIGHTRWATHGKVSDANAHPFLSNDGKFAAAHNGIVENYLSLRENLIRSGYEFSSETDSETVVHLLEKNYKGDALSAVLETARALKGSFAVVITTSYDDKLYAIKNKSPLVAGISGEEAYLCSDIRCVSHWAKRVAVAPDNTVVVASSDGIKFYDFSGRRIAVEFFETDAAEQIQTVEGDFMLKEILEIPQRIADAKRGYVESGGLELSPRFVSKLRRVYLLGCGTAYNSGLEISEYARRILDIDVIPVIASEFIYGSYPVDGRTLAICISQSGETADTLRACEKVSKSGGYPYAVTNTSASSLSFACKSVKNICAGGEFAVASTKAYNCQLVTMLLMFTELAYLRKTVDMEFYDRIFTACDALPKAVDEVLSRSYEISSVADEIKDSSSVFFIGRTADYPTASEGSLKLKEISYIHSEAYPAGELKHGTLALMEKGVTVVALSTDSDLQDKMASSINEVRARGARVVCVTPYGMDNADIIRIPVVNKLLYGVISVVPLQLLAYYVAKRLGRDVDKPRNLAKSVTVE